MSKSNGPKIEPCRIPYSIFNMLLKHSFILVRWVRFLKYENISLRDKGECPYQSNFATLQLVNPAGIYLFKVNNRNTRTRCEICSKLTIKTAERR